MKEYIKKLHIPYFRNIYMRDGLPSLPKEWECGIINLDDTSGDGTHYVAYAKTRKDITYFDSFGLEPPLEFIHYIRGNRLKYNMAQVQDNSTENCGRLCLHFLLYFWKNKIKRSE